MELKAEVKTVIKTTSSNLEQYINHCAKGGLLTGVTINGHYDLNCEEEVSNYSSKEYDISREWLDKYPVSDGEREELLSGKLSFGLTNILALMAEQGLVEYGEYIVDTSW
jgi:hypothetical protein